MTIRSHGCIKWEQRKCWRGSNLPDMYHENNAVEVTSACKKYSSRLVLKNVSMKVPEGSIYGLLGPSGCGKTTLLNSLVGRVQLDSGSIKMSISSKSEIGYMPQDITLYPEMSIREHMNYYGRLYALPKSLIQKRGEELMEFLQLPSLDHIIKNLSGGQQRRVSLCVTLIHSPQLLILDEPTVGVDIILSHNIWEKLLHMSRNEGKTIIITTHYIEEARRSNMIGLMRNGSVLAEDEPEKLMELNECETLEDTFLKLCAKDESEQDLSEHDKSYNLQMKKPKPHLKDNNIVTTHRIVAHVLKNIYWMRRNIPMMLFTFALPIIQCCLASMAIGEKPNGISLAVVNEEIPEGMASCLRSDWLGPMNCSDLEIPYSCYIIQKLVNQSIGIVPFNTLSNAERSVRRNYQWGLVHFNSKFSEALKERIRSIQSMKNQTILELSQMTVQLDTTNQVISNSLQGDLIRSFLETVKDIGDNCDWLAFGAKSPIKIEQPIFGTENPSIRQYMTPANAILFEFYFPVLFTVSVLIDEKSSGLLDRSLIAGLGLIEITIGHIAMQYAVLLVQTILEWLILFQFFDNPILPGSFPSCFFLLFLIGTCGVFYGFLIVYQSNSFTEAAVITFGGYFPIFMLSGAIWPIEGMHYILRWISLSLPVTRSVEAFRSLSIRGWPFSHPTVYLSFVTIAVWTAFYCLLCFSLMKFRGSKL